MNRTVFLILGVLLVISCQKEEPKPFVYENPIVGLWEVQSATFDGSVRTEFDGMSIGFQTEDQISGTYFTNKPQAEEFNQYVNCLWSDQGNWRWEGPEPLKLPDSSNILPVGNLIFEESGVEYVASYSQRFTKEYLSMSFNIPECEADSTGRNDTVRSFWAFTFERIE